MTLLASRPTTVTKPSAGAVRRRRDFRAAGTGTYVVLTALAIFALGPIVLFFFNALKTENEYAESSLGLPPTWRWQNFADAWTTANMGAGLANSAIVVAGTVVLTCVVAGLAAYALARLEIHGNGAFMVYILVATSLPSQMFLVPLFFMWARAGLYDTRLGLVLICTGLFSPFATLLLRSFMLGLPREFEEAARMDGANELRVLTRIVLPTALPGLLTVALTTGLSTYNEFLFAVTLIQSESKMPVSTTLFAFQEGYTQNYALVSAAGIIMVAPMLILFLALQRRFIDGLSSSGLAGT